MSALSHPEIAQLLDEFQSGIETAMGGDFVGLYLFGSLVYGDFTPGVSDIDLLAVSRRSVTEVDTDRLRAMHRALIDRYPEWNDRIEVAYQSLHGLRTFHTERSPMGIISPGEAMHLIEAGDDWLINWYFVLDHGITLAGPPPETIIAPISHEAFVTAARDQGRRWPSELRHVKDQRGESYAILTVCRALYTHHTGELVSKIKAARWVQGRHPEWTDLIEMALERRLSAEDNGPVDTFEDTVRFIDMVVAEIDRDTPEENG